jgi:c-di-GMP-related signal transduction protein
VTHVSATEFERRFAWVDQQQSMETVTYLGQENGRAFIRLRSMSTIGEKWSDRVIYVELAELDSRFRDSLPQKSQALYK